jgi:uncharacterized membrane protein YraQ (UPF0718 family)
MLSEAAMTALGFFWKAGWAFVLGYAISAMIQVFVPRARLTRFMGGPGFKSVGTATGFGAISSSCSFAALAAARALLKKGAHFVAVVAFMFASTNLVIELGILILIFLGWQFLAAEIVGGLVLIVISSTIIRLTYPRSWIEAARERVEGEGDGDEESFDWRSRLRSREGWRMVGRRFGMEWGMVWQEITIGFTIAGLVAALVPASFWETLFLAERAAESPGNFLLVLYNAAIAPFIAAATFIGSMGNIPLATVLASGGVLFGGIMGFIYSDLMVPPLVKINAKYYGWRVALYIAAVMYASIVSTAVLLHYAFLWTGLTPETTREVSEVTRFKVDYTLFMNIAAVALVGVLWWLARGGGSDHRREGDHREGDHGGGDDSEGDGHSHHHGGGGGLGVQGVIAVACAVFLLAGLLVRLIS